MTSIRKNIFTNQRHYIIIIVVALAAYWPLTFHIYSMKNDALVYFLPWRYHISESIQHFNFPLWSPYLYTGLPLHEDIQSGVWNPVVLIISLFVRYNMSVFEWEMLIYVLAGGIGFFKLCKAFNFNKDISLLLACSYMCCGFIIDSGSIIPWVTSAAYLPFVFYYFKRSIEKPGTDITIKLAFSASLLFLAGYLSFFIVTIYILEFSLLAFVLHAGLKNCKKQFIHIFISGLLTFIICSPALLSFIDYFPFYERGNGLSLDAAQTNPFTIYNTVSFLFPPASYKLSLPNDINSRNSYFGLLPLIFLIFSFKRVNRSQLLIIIISITIFLLSLGNATPLRAFFFNMVPLFNTFRHPGALRIFTITGLLLLSGFGMQQYFNDHQILKVKRIIYGFIGFMVLTLLILIIKLNPNEFSLLQEPIERNQSRIKEILDHSTVLTWATISCAIQIMFLILFIITLKKKSGWPLHLVYIINLILFTSLCMPFTLVSQHKVKEVNTFINSFPEGFPINKAWEYIDNPSNDSVGITTNGYTKFYEKRISFQGFINNPTVSTSYQEFLQDHSLRSMISKHDFAYSDKNEPVQLISFNPNEFIFQTQAKEIGTLQIVQQYHPNWKAYIDGNKTKIDRNQITFMQVTLPAGVHTIKIQYQLPYLVVTGIIASLLVIISGIFILIRKPFLINEKSN
ncbi:MAG TPA: YfhO family protein [Flavisolibacter sp.]|nr:YfhO family protein [Flavisolibacter sp.]